MCTEELLLLHQASNVATYIAHGDVALSVLMTTASTLGAIIMTPLLTGLLAGTLVPVDAKVGASSPPNVRSVAESHGICWLPVEIGCLSSEPCCTGLVALSCSSAAAG